MKTSNANLPAALPRYLQTNQFSVCEEHAPAFFRFGSARELLAGIVVQTVLMALSVLAASAAAAPLFVLFLVSTATTANAGVVTFEDLPDANLFSGGGQNIGNFYPGITFGPNVTGLSVSRFGGYASDAFPPHSGDVVIWDATDPTITISFASAIMSFGVWYTSFDPLTLQAFDAGGDLLGAVVGDPNTDGTTGASSFLSFSNPGIQSVTLSSSAGLYTLDD